MTTPTAYPLAWPPGYPRTPSAARERGRFNTVRQEASKYTPGHMNRVARSITIAEALKRLQRELDLICARYTVVSSNVELRLDGLPRSNQREPEDPGVAVYFQFRGRPTSLPCDRYTTVAANIAAVAAHIEATRAIERHGVGTMEQMFAGFQAIRGPGPKPWREVLGFPPDSRPTRDEIQAKRRDLARQHHPDGGGSDAAMAEINAAADRALEETGR